MDVHGFLNQLQADPTYGDQIVRWHRTPARDAAYAELDPPPPPVLRDALAAQGINRFYTHQAQAITAARENRDVVVVTGTASGKTLCYNVPVIERVLMSRRSRALYLFPLKALAQDQLRKLEALGLWKEVRAGTYDGDTPTHDRRMVRQAAHVVLTNPDMLHLGLLPHHGLWSDFLAHLDYLVLDELHTYRGVFGSHTALVLRRLLRLCEHYGARPSVIACSATIANPADLAKQLTGRDCEVVDEDGAPSGTKHIVVWNPPLTDAEGGQRRSGNIEATFLLRELVSQGIRTLAFTTARQEAELILRYLKSALDGEHPELVDLVAAYRAGYLASDRRAIEQKLSAGELRAVVSTVALEAGIDIGGLDAAVIIGYPGTVASFRQQAGRAGRGRRDALAILVCRASLIDQFFALHPDALWSAPVEEARIDPQNIYILGDHLLCAAFEHPLSDDDLAEFGPGTAEVMPIFADEGYVREADGKWFYIGPPHPAGSVNLRSAGSQGYELLDTTRNEVLGVEDDTRLWVECYPGAIHLHEGEQYQVTDVDQSERRVLLQPVEVDYFTRPNIDAQVVIEEVTDSRDLAWVGLGYGTVTVTLTTHGFRRYRVGSLELLATEDVDCPPQSVETTAFWVCFDPEVRKFVDFHGGEILGGLNGMQNALTGVLPLLAMCDPRDLQGTALSLHPELEQPAIFVWDEYPGGIGLTERGYEAADLMLSRAHDVVAACRCTAGCPACVQSPFNLGGNWPMDKALALVLLRAAIGRDFTAEPTEV